MTHKALQKPRKAMLSTALQAMKATNSAIAQRKEQQVAATVLSAPVQSTTATMVPA